MNAVSGSDRGHVLAIREVRDHPSLEALRPRWSELADRLPDPSPFLRPEYLLPQIRSVQDRYDYRVLTAWDGDRLVGLAPLFRRTLSKWGIGFRVLSFPIHGTPPPFDLLIDRSVAGAMDGFVDHWRGRTDWDLLELANVRKGAATEEQLAEAADRASLRLETAHSRYSHSVTVQGSWDDYLRSRSRNLRSNYNRAWRRCREIGPARVARFPEEDIGFDRALEAVFHVLVRSWKGPPDGVSSLRTFFADLATELHRAGMLVIRVLYVNEEPLAYLLEIDHRRRFTAFHTAYDSSAGQVWAGVLILGDGIRNAHERGYACYDLGGEARTHITQWANRREEFDDLRLSSPRLLSRVKLPLYRAVRSRRQSRAHRETESWKMETRATGSRGAPPRG